MSQNGKTERMAHLRSAIAGIEAYCGPAQPRAPARLSLARAFDPMLGGGLSQDGLHEIAPAHAGDGAAALGFALALAARFAAAGPSQTVLLASEDFCAHEAGALYGPGLAAYGLGLGQLVLVRAPDAPTLLWTMEEALKSGALAAVIGEIWSFSRHYSLAASRRLLLAARAGRAAGPARSRRRLRTGGRHLQRRRDAVRNRLGFKPAAGAGRRATCPARRARLLRAAVESAAAPLRPGTADARSRRGAPHPPRMEWR